MLSGRMRCDSISLKIFRILSIHLIPSSCYHFAVFAFPLFAEVFPFQLSSIASFILFATSGWKITSQTSRTNLSEPEKSFSWKPDGIDKKKKEELKCWGRIEKFINDFELRIIIGFSGTEIFPCCLACTVHLLSTVAVPHHFPTPNTHSPLSARLKTSARQNWYWG